MPTKGAVVDADVVPLDGEMAELSLLLPRAQALALIEAAQHQGVSVAQFMRQLVRQALAPMGTPFSAN
jgi:hypothetical protein